MHNGAGHEIASGAHKTGRAFAFQREQEDRPASPKGQNLGIGQNNFSEFLPSPCLRRPFSRGQSLENRLHGLDVESIAIKKAPCSKHQHVDARPADLGEDGGGRLVVLSASVVRERHAAH